MSSNSFGQLFRITSFGESHGPGIGVVIDGMPARVPLDLGAQNEERRVQGVFSEYVQDWGRVFGVWSVVEG